MTYQEVLDTTVNANDLKARIVVDEWKGEVTEYIEKYEYYRLSIPDIKEKWAQQYPLPKIIPIASISAFAYYIVKAKLPRCFHYVKEKNWEDIDDIAIAEMVVFRSTIVKVLEENGIDPPSDLERAWIPKCSMCTRENCTVGDAFNPDDDARICSDTFTPKLNIGVWVVPPPEQPFFFVTVEDTVYVSTFGSQNPEMLFELQDWNKRRVRRKLENLGLNSEAMTDILTKISLYKSLRRRLQRPLAQQMVLPESNMRLNHEKEVFIPEASDGYFEHKAGFYVRRGDNWIVSELTYHRGTVFKKDEEGNIVESHTAVRPILFYNKNNQRGFFDPRKDVMEFDGKSIFLEGQTDITSHLHTLMSYETTQRFLNGETVTVREVYPRLIERIKRFVNCHWDERLYDLIACIGIGTHFFDVFTAFPIIFIYGPPITGKGRVGKCIIYAGHRGIDVVDPTSPTFFRMIDALRPTFLFDELTMAWEGFQMHWRAAYKKGAKVPRMEKVKDERMALRLFEQYGPTTACSTVPISGKEKEATESRFINIYMRSAPDPNPDKKDPEEIHFDDIRNDLYLCRLTQAKDVDVMSGYLTGLNLLPGRDWELWKPILTIGAMAGQDVLDRVWSYAKEQVLTKREEQFEKEKKVVEGIRVLMGENIEISFTPKELSNRMYELLKEDFGYKEFEDIVMARQNEMDVRRRFNKVYSHWHLGHILRRMDLKPKSVPRGKQYTLTKVELKDLARRFGVAIA